MLEPRFHSSRTRATEVSASSIRTTETNARYLSRCCQVKVGPKRGHLGHHFATAPDREGNLRRAIVFGPGLGEEGQEGTPPDLTEPDVGPSRLWSLALGDLRARCLSRTTRDTPPKERCALLQVRTEAIRIYALRRASGRCEGCGDDAPFKTKAGQPFLEVHHLRRKADGGPDHPRWVAALCPNCHRRVHHGADGAVFNGRLARAIAVREPS